MDSQLSMRTTIQLNNGRDMPVLGLGVARMAEGAETEQSVLWALEAGYRLIDTAKIYGNEDRRQQLQRQAIRSVGRGSRHPPGCQSSAVSSLFLQEGVARLLQVKEYCS